MGLKRRRFSREFKILLLEEVSSGKTLAQVAREHEINPNMLLRWKEELRSYGIDSFAGNGKLYKEEAKIAELERKIGQLIIENDLLKKVLKRLERSDPGKKIIGRGRQ